MRHPIRNSLFVGVSVIALSAVPAIAQECEQEISRIEAGMASSDMAENDRATVQEQLDQARGAKDDGAEQRCLEIVGAVVALVPSAEAAEGEQEQGADLTAELKVDQPQPQVTVKQKPPKVTVRIGKPTITVRMPKPEVTVDMPEPEVTIEQQDPEVNVVMAEPEISLDDQSEGGDAEQQQAMISVERDEQAPEVQLEQEEPEVMVEQQEPTVNVTRSEQPDGEEADQTNLQSEQDQENQQDQQARMSVAGMTPDEIIGRNVVNSQNAEVAEIYELVKETDSDRMFAILSVGGFLGLGEKEVAIPLDQFEIRDDGTFVLPQQTEEQLESMPHYEPVNYEPVQRAG